MCIDFGFTIVIPTTTHQCTKQSDLIFSACRPRTISASHSSHPLTHHITVRQSSFSRRFVAAVVACGQKACITSGRRRTGLLVFRVFSVSRSFPFCQAPTSRHTALLDQHVGGKPATRHEVFFLLRKAQAPTCRQNQE